MILFAIILFTALFVPGTGVPGLGTVWPADFLVLGILAHYAFRNYYELLALLSAPFFRVYFLMLIWLGAMTIVMQSDFSGSRDYNDYISFAGRCRPVFYLLALASCMTGESANRKALFLLLLVFALEAVLAFVQRSNLLDINNQYSIKFRAGEVLYARDYIALEGSRVMGTFGNPNCFGTYLSIMSCFFAAAATAAKNILLRLLNLSCYAMAVYISLFLAKTRQGTMMALVAGGIVFLLTLRSVKLKHVLIVGITAYFGLVVMKSVIQNDFDLNERFGILLGKERLMENSSVLGRRNYLPTLLKYYAPYLMTGAGMSGYNAAGVIDSGWVAIIIAGGIPMLFLFCRWSLLVPKIALQELRAKGMNCDYADVHLGIVAMTPVVWLTLLLNSLFSETNLMIVWGLFHLVSLRASTKAFSGEYASCSPSPQIPLPRRQGNIGNRPGLIK